MNRIFLALVFLLASVSLAPAQESPSTAETPVEQYLYVLRLVPRLLEAKNWTAQDNQIVGRHFQRLQSMTEQGTVILAGRTLNPDPSSFGIVIFEAASPDEARRIMEEDPAVKEGIMTSELFPYRVALQRKNPHP
ncbi:MAG TPA: YciI family protein [Longimicrobiaceae bacterium]|nr:YciI family protein [Longimicrobiaceae bacterium]